MRNLAAGIPLLIESKVYLQAARQKEYAINPSTGQNVVVMERPLGVQDP